MVRPARLERATFWFVAKRSIQLSYGRIPKNQYFIDAAGNPQPQFCRIPHAASSTRTRQDRGAQSRSIRFHWLAQCVLYGTLIGAIAHDSALRHVALRDRVFYEVGRAFEIQLLHDVRTVMIHGAGADTKGFSYLLV